MAEGEARPAPREPFLCDGSLGGLARWLRAAGYDAQWRLGLSGEALLAEARRVGGTLLTSDRRIMERREIRDGRLPAIWVSSGLTRMEQLRGLMQAHGLRPRAPRCMACGGALRAVAKDDVAARIPPRTAAWRDEYFVCAGCGQLFWEGTHWQRITEKLRRAAGL